MRYFAGICLAFGLLIMVTAWSVAVSAMSDHELRAKNTVMSTPNACLYCHLDAHANWEEAVVIPQMVEVVSSLPEMDTHMTTIPTSPAQMCINCHAMNENLELPLEAMPVDVLTTRLSTLRQELDRVYNQYPDWDTNTYRTEKSEAQVIAERIGILIEAIEAGGTWGFHEYNYTEEILTEAEALMHDLRSHVGL